jgi:DNA-binding LytR/AlgR family response regulator
MQPFFFIKDKGKYVKVCFEEIAYIEALDNYIRLFTDAKAYMVLSTMKQLETLLPAEFFCRIHRSYIVSLGRITSFDKYNVYLGSKNLPLSEQYKNVLHQSVVLVPGVEQDDTIAAQKTNATG